MKINSFTKSYGDKLALSMPELDLDPSKIYAVIGANGSGKSTLARVLSGVIRPDGPWDAPKEKIGCLPQRSYAFSMTVIKNLLLNTSDRQRAESLLEKLGMAHLKNKKASRLSGGETQKLALARLLAGTYDCIILDEPTSSMDVSSTLTSEKLIRSYVEETGCGAVVITHSIPQAERLADEVLYLAGGELVEWGKKDILRNPQTPELVNYLNFSALRKEAT